MRIAIDIRHLAQPEPSGVGQYTIALIHQLAREFPHEEFLLFASGSKEALTHLPQFRYANVQVETITQPNKWIHFQQWQPWGPMLESYLSKKPDLWFFPNLAFFRTQLPYVMTVHDISFLLQPQFFSVKSRLWHYLARFRKKLRQARHVIAVSETTKRDLEHVCGLASHQVTATPLGMHPWFHGAQEPSDASFLHAHDIKKPYIFHLATQEPRKNQISIVEAFSLWKTAAQDTEMQLVIAGGRGWHAKALDNAIAQSSHKDAIHVLNYVPEKHKPALFRHAKAVVFPSFYEGFGLPVLEALACKTPVITSFSGSLSEVCKTAAIYIDPFNVQDLVLAFQHIMTSPISPNINTEIYSWKMTAKKTMNVFQTV